MITEDRDRALRPASFDGYIGQEQLKRRLQVSVTAARRATRPMEHVLLIGPPGSGKTTMAQVIADAMGDPIVTIMKPLNPRDLLRKLYELAAGTLFIDEIHSWSRRQLEPLYPLLDEGKFETRSGFETFEWLTVIAGTTEKQLIPPPLKQRFSVAPSFAPYTEREMATMVGVMADKVGLQVDPETCAALGRAAAGTPRVARSLVFAARDLAGAGEPMDIDSILAFAEIEDDGLDGDHIAYLNTLMRMGGDAGIETLASVLQDHPTNLKRTERLLLERQLVRIERGYGRTITMAGRRRVTGDTERRRSA